MSKKKQRPQTRQPDKQKPAISPVMIGLVVAGAILLVVGLVVLGNQSQASEPLDVSRLPTLGDSNAPVTLIEYSDYG